MGLNYLPDNLLILEKLARQNPMGRVNSVLNMSRSFTSPVITTPMDAFVSKNRVVVQNHTPVTELIRQSIVSKIAQPTFLSVAERFKSPLSALSAIEYHLDEFDEEEIDEVQLIEVVTHAKAVIQDIYKNHNLLDTLNSRLFEEIVAELLDHKGFEVNLTKRTRDGGYDILALSTVGGFPIKFLVECKRWKDKVGIEIIRSFCDVIEEENANKGIIVTTSYFSKDVKENQEQKRGHILDLRNRNDVIQWVSDYHQI